MRITAQCVECGDYKFVDQLVKGIHCHKCNQISIDKMKSKNWDKAIVLRQASIDLHKLGFEVFENTNPKHPTAFVLERDGALFRAAIVSQWTFDENMITESTRFAPYDYVIVYVRSTPEIKIINMSRHAIDKLL